QTQSVLFTVSVSQINTTNISATSFSVTVTNNTVVTGAPYLALPLTLTNITSCMTLTFTAFATNTDSSANTLTFSLDANAVAAGATITNITPTNGLFQWTPAAAQAGFVYEMRVIVTELSSPPLSTTQAFTVNVLLTNNCSQYPQFLAAVAAGGYVPLTNCPTLVLSNTITISNSVVLDAVSGSVTIAGNNALGASGINGTDGGSDPNYGKDGSDASPGHAGIGGAVFNLGTLIANSCQFTNNSAKGGTGGNGGNGSSGSYRGGNGGHGGDGAFGFGGAIYSAGTYLSLSNNCVFFGNTATGGSGGSGGTNGTGAFSGYAGTGGAGAEGSGAAVYCANSAVMLNCDFVNNTAQGGNSAPSGEAGGGYGVK